MRVLSVQSGKLFFAVRLIVYCLKIIGLAPFSVRIEKPAQINTNDSSIQAFFFSKVGLTYNILLLIPITIVPVIHGPTFIYKHSLKGVPIASLIAAIMIAQSILFVFTAGFVVISWGFRQKNAASVMNRLFEIDARLSGLKKRPFNKRTLIFLILHIIINVILWVMFWLTLVRFVKVSYSHLVTEFFGRLPGFIIYWFIIEYVTIVGLVSRELEAVNKHLLDSEPIENYLFHSPVRNGIQVTIVSNLSSSQLASLKVLRSIRTTLFEVCEDISEFFSLPILFSIVCCFIPVFEKLYHLFQVTHLPSDVTRKLILIVVLKYFYPVISLALNVTQIRKEAESTGQIVHKLLAVVETEDIKAELEQFSFQLLHERIDFTAYGLFTLDTTLLQSMLAGAAGYAIILMQFASSEYNCNCNCNDTSVE